MTGVQTCALPIWIVMAAMAISPECCHYSIMISLPLGPMGRENPGACWGGRGSGAPVGIRTPNLLIRSQMLYPLSYGRLSRTATAAQDPMRIAERMRIAEISREGRGTGPGGQA